MSYIRSGLRDEFKCSSLCSYLHDRLYPSSPFCRTYLFFISPPVSYSYIYSPLYVRITLSRYRRTRPVRVNGVTYINFFLFRYLLPIIVVVSTYYRFVSFCPNTSRYRRTRLRSFLLTRNRQIMILSWPKVDYDHGSVVVTGWQWQWHDGQSHLKNVVCKNSMQGTVVALCSQPQWT